MSERQKLLQEKERLELELERDKLMAEMKQVKSKPKYSAGEAFLDKLSQSMSFNYDIPIMAKGEELLAKGQSLFTGEEVPQNLYEQKKAEFEARRQQLSQEYPLTSMAGTVTGAVAPGAALAKGVRAARVGLGMAPQAATLAGKAGTLATEGAIAGGLYKPEGGEPGVFQIEERLKGAALGAGLGAAMPYAGKALKETGKAVGRGMRAGARKGLSAVGSVPEENISKFFSDPDRYLSAPTREEVVQNISGVIDDIENSVTTGKMRVKEGKVLVKELERSIREGRLEKKGQLMSGLKSAKDRLNQSFKQAEEALKGKSAPTSLAPEIDEALTTVKQRVREGSKEAFQTLDDAPKTKELNFEDILIKAEDKVDELAGRGSESAQSRAKKLSGYVKFIKDKMDKGSLSPREAKKIIQDLDSDISSWEQATGTFDDPRNLALKELRKNIDTELKASIPAYKEQMSKVAEETGLLSEASKRFGKPERAISKLSRIDKQNAQIDREILEDLGKMTGKDFKGPISDFIENQRLLKSKSRMEGIRQSLPEAAEVRGMEGKLAVAKRQAKPKAVREAVRQSRQFRDLRQAEAGLRGAEEVKKKFVGWSTRTVEDKVNQVMRGKKFVQGQLEELGKMNDKDFVDMVERLKVSEAFTKDATRGSRNVNLWSLIGLSTSGGILGGPMGAATGAVIGSLMDRYGPRVTKQILLGASRMTKPTVAAFQRYKVPKKVAQELIETLQGTALVAQPAMRERGK